MPSRYGRLFGLAHRDFGPGAKVPELPDFVPIRFDSFAGAFNVGDAEEGIPAQASSDALDIEVNRRDSLIKAPGTVAYETFDETRTPEQIALFVGLSLAQEIILFDAPALGIKKSAATAALWTDIPGVVVDAEAKFFWTTFADFFVFSNGLGSVYTHQIGSDVVVADPLIPNGSAFMVIAARLFVGAPVIDGVKQPMVVAWSGILGYNKFDYVNDLGSGFEPLISDQSEGDAIVAMRAMGLDFAAIICRNSVWIGRRTGDLDRPLAFEPRTTGKGCVAAATVRTVLGGVMYLSSEGLELFDGNESKHVSNLIDDDLLPLDYDNIDKYNSAYNSTSQRYYLFTPTVTYLLDLKYGRWYKRSLVAKGAVPFAETLPSTPWSAMVGSWTEHFESWLTLLGTASELPSTIFLGVDDDHFYALHRENYPSYQNFGVNFRPRWNSLLVDSPNVDYLVTTQKVHVRYKESGELDLWLPNLAEIMTKITSVPLILSMSAPRPTLTTKKVVFTGLTSGFMLEILTGLPEISLIELRVLPRGPRIQAAPALAPEDFFDFSEDPFGTGGVTPPAMIVLNYDTDVTLAEDDLDGLVPLGLKGAPMYMTFAGRLTKAAFEVSPVGSLELNVLKNGVLWFTISVVGDTETVIEGVPLGILDFAEGDTLQADVVSCDLVRSYTLTMAARRT